MPNRDSTVSIPTDVYAELNDRCRMTGDDLVTVITKDVRSISETRLVDRWGIVAPVTLDVVRQRLRVLLSL